jgi:amidase
MQPSDDPLGALVPGPRPAIAGAAIGPLAGVTFAAKDIFDVAGFVTGCGNPDYGAAQQPARQHAWAVAKLLAAGATLTAKVITDEFAFSLNGQNAHYGTPTNSNAPGRVCGGSSCGSASAVAGGLVDTALGSDTGGSVRVPASFCGLWGIRPTHGAIPLDGVMSLAPSFDTVGWFARDGAMLGRVGAALLPPDKPREAGGGEAFARLLLPEDAWALAWPDTREVLAPEITRLEQRLGPAGRLLMGEPGGGLEAWMLRFRAIQGTEIKATAGAWVQAHRPRLGPEIQERFDWVAGLPAAEGAAAAAPRAEFSRRLDALLGDDGLMVLPSAPGAAPFTNTPDAELRQWRLQVLSLTCIAGLSGLPQVSIPLGRVEGAPVGLSLVAPRGRDRALLAFAQRFAQES